MEGGGASFEELRNRIEAATATNDAAALLVAADEMALLNTDEARALSSRSKGHALRLTGRFAKAIAANATAIELYERLGDHQGMADALVNNGFVYIMLDEISTAIEVLERAYDLYRHSSTIRGMANATATMGTAYLHVGDYVNALDHYQRGLALFEEINDRYGISNTVSNIGLLHFNTGDRSEALRFLLRGLAMHEDNGNDLGAAHVSSNIANTYSAFGDYPEALNYAFRALEKYEKIGNPHGQATVLLNMGTIHNALKNHEDALICSRNALKIHEELGTFSGQSSALNNIAMQCVATGNYNAALESFERSLQIAREHDLPLDQERAEFNIAEVAFLRGDAAEARRLLDTLVDHHFVNPELHANVLVLRGHLYQADGSLDDAVSAYQAALDRLVSVGNKSEQAKVHTYLRDVAQKRNNFADYITHNEAHARITEEILGQDAMRRSAKAVAEREFRSERAEHEKHKTLLYNTLPKAIADRVLRGEQVNDSIDEACVMFLDLAGFTTMSSTMEAHQVVDVLGRLFTTCDEICARHQVMKIKTIGDSYMAAALGEQPNSRITKQPNSAVERITLAAREIMSAIQNSNGPLQARIGLHCGPVQAGIIGTERMQYDVWGDTVNVASRMESAGEPGRIHVSDAFAEILRQSENSQFPVPNSLIERGEIEIKGKGTMTTYFLV